MFSLCPSAVVGICRPGLSGLSTRAARVGTLIVDWEWTHFAV